MDSKLLDETPTSIRAACPPERQTYTIEEAAKILGICLVHLHIGKVCYRRSGLLADGWSLSERLSECSARRRKGNRHAEVETHRPR